MNIFVRNNQKKIKISTLKIKNLTKNIAHLLELNDDIEISIILVDDKEMVKLNEKYLGKKEETDVLSWECNFENSPFCLVGDIAISVGRAFKQAKEYKNTFEGEIALLITHGLLHLLGYEDKNKRERNVMNRKSMEILKSVVS